MFTDTYTCKNCGYTSQIQFHNDICPACSLTDWKCAYCSYTVTARAPKQICPECGAASHFENITSYIPDWGILETANIVA